MNATFIQAAEKVNRIARMLMLLAALSDQFSLTFSSRKQVPEQVSWGPAAKNRGEKMRGKKERRQSLLTKSLKFSSAWTGH